MRNLIYSQVKGVIARALGECENGARVLALANESQERLLNRPSDPLGSTVRYRFCSSNACITLPRQVRTVLRWALCSCPGLIRPEWFELMSNGPGLQNEDGCSSSLFDHGTVPAFQEVDGTGKYIRVYAQNAVDAGKKVILKFYRDDTKQKQYTLYGGAVQEGEELTLVAPPNYALTTATVMKGGLYSVVKALTSYPINLYEFDGSANSATLAQYEPSETTPIYRRYLLPGLSSRGGCGESDCAGEACDQPVITALVRLQHVPIALDNDPLVLHNIAALKLMAMAILAEEQHREQQAQALEAKALRELEGELASYQGSGMTVTVGTADRSIWGAGMIENAL